MIPPRSTRLESGSESDRVAVSGGPPTASPRHRLVLMALSVGVIVYSFAVLSLVIFSGDIGTRCIFGTELKEHIDPRLYEWHPAPPGIGDTLVEIDGQPIQHYTDYVLALRRLHHQRGETIPIRWRTPEGFERTAEAVVQPRPMRAWIGSVVWFLQEMGIFAIGVLVVWKRPDDTSARLFFWLCIVTVGAFMGGYHWTEIVVSPWLIYPFAAFALFVPIVSLHFYLVFPRPNPILARHPRAVLTALYGVPTLFLGALWAGMIWSRSLRGQSGEVVETALGVIKRLALGYVGLSVVVFALCVLCLGASYLAARTRSERNQVKWIFLASLLATPFIGYLILGAWFDSSSLGRDSAAWPMFVVSLLFTVAYALSITRYKLMQAEEWINRGVVYVAVSVMAGVLYSALLVGGTLLIGLKLQADQYSREAVVVACTAIVMLVLSGAARERFHKVIDRRFYREKYKFDQAMRKMSRAVGSLVDRPTLGRRLLEAAADVLRLEWGAIYLFETAGGPLRLAACHGPEPDEQHLPADNPLVQRLRQVATIRVPHGMALSAASDPATDAMIALGGEVATTLEAEGELAGLLVLGPKRSGMPYEDEEIAFLGALGSVATLALHSAEIQQTLQALDHELRDKVEKIAEQQRRILILQDQLMDRGETPAGLSPIPEGDPEAFEAIKGSSREMKELVQVARKVATSPSAVLIRGESGTGKELLAAAIHAASLRASGPFVKVHCAALSQTLLESELFGHVKGAFTGADRDRVGRFEQAHAGTLFLDEIGDITWEVQTKLLRVLQERSFERVGSSQPITVDVRILAATHQDLEALIRGGRFRQDLYYRLNVISIQTPALRERRDDIFELAVHFLGRQAQRMGKAVTRIDDEAIEALMAHDWPGNVRELENVIERAVVLADGPTLTRANLPIGLGTAHRPKTRRRFAAVPAAGSAARSRARRRAARRPLEGGNGPLPSVASPISAVERPATAASDHDHDDEFQGYERQRLIDALEEAEGVKSEAARLLGMPRSTFFSKLRKHGLA